MLPFSQDAPRFVPPEPGTLRRAFGLTPDALFAKPCSPDVALAAIAAARAHESGRKGMHDVVTTANADGLQLLRRGKANEAFDHFKYAEAVLASNGTSLVSCDQLLALICSNLGCYYMHIGRPRAALKYLERAIKVEEETLAEVAERKYDTSPGNPSHLVSLAKTKLTACAALSGVGNYVEANRLAAEAVELLLSVSGSDPDDTSGDQKSKEDSGLMAVACYNLGATQEFLGHWTEGAVSYRHGAETAAKMSGRRSPLAVKLARNAGEAFAKAQRESYAKEISCQECVPAVAHRPSSRAGCIQKPWIPSEQKASKSSGSHPVSTPVRPQSSEGLRPAWMSAREARMKDLSPNWHRRPKSQDRGKRWQRVVNKTYAATSPATLNTGANAHIGVPASLKETRDISQRCASRNGGGQATPKPNANTLITAAERFGRSSLDEALL